MYRLKINILSLLLLFSILSCTSEAETQPMTTPNQELSFNHLSSSSSPLSLSPDGETLWVVNPDANSITEINTKTLTASEPIAVGKEPWGIVTSPLGVVVANRADGTVSLFNDGQQKTIVIGAEPSGVALSPSGNFAYVVASADDEVIVIDLTKKTIVERISVGDMPWAIAVSNDGAVSDADATIVVTHRVFSLRKDGQVAKNDSREGKVSILKQNSSSTHYLHTELTISPYEFGFVNALESVAVVGDKAIVAHLLNSPDEPRAFTSTISGGISTLSLSQEQEIQERRIHLTDSDFSTPVNFPRAIALNVDGTKAYVALAGTNSVMGIDLTNANKARLLGFWAVGDNPRGIVLSPDGSRAYVMNYLSRDVSVLDLTDTVRRPEIARISVTPETLEKNIIRGKILFNNANDPRMSRLGWISCASCHLDGGVDGTTWSTPEGLRQTMPLWNLEGTAPFHISATRDEVQDSENDIEHLMNGVGLAAGPVKILLGEELNSKRSEDLDALATFVLTGIRVPQASLTTNQMQIERGRQVFSKANCISCHSGENWTISQLPRNGYFSESKLEVQQVLKDVGTYNPSGDVLGANGFDVPTLLGLHASAPYLHDGSATTLFDVLDNPTHVPHSLTQKERRDLSVFLKSIDGSTEAF